MSITNQDVEHVANLARLELTEEENAKFTEQLNAILKYAEKLDELDTTESNRPPMCCRLQMSCVRISSRVRGRRMH